MSSDEYLEIPTNLLGSWNYKQPIAVGIGELQCTLLVEYAPSSMYELLKLKNPYKDKSAKFNLFVYNLRVLATALWGAGVKDTLWLGPFVGSLIEEDGNKKLNIITKFPDTDDTEKNGWSIIPSVPISDNGFNEKGEMSIYGGFNLKYHDIYNSRFIIPYYDDEKEELSLKVRILCKGECPSKLRDRQEYDETDGNYYAIFRGIGTKGCTNYNSNISDCLPGCKYATDGYATIETAPDLTWRLVAIISTFILFVIVLVFLIKLIRKLIKR